MDGICAYHLPILTLALPGINLTLLLFQCNLGVVWTSLAACCKKDGAGKKVQELHFLDCDYTAHELD
ncbi:hypothetical protein AAHA92_04704 [Salvia divinorum]|uniref:Uncharacterized protein n=1 Tax=Salvia divinorum TaxID=28513 RepID=A0ABD1I036_SALDI